MSFERPRVMGILNATPDSFHAGSRVDAQSSISKARTMVQEGADMLDLGGQSSRPGAETIGAEAEWVRIQPVLEGILEQWPDLPLSVDTYHADVARKAIEAGAHMINDISAGTLDPELPHAVAEGGVPMAIMHMQGTPKTMQKSPAYIDVHAEVKSHLSQRVQSLKGMGIEHLIVDPGFGFGKSLQDNYLLLSNLRELQELRCPVLIGISRKSMIYKPLDLSPDTALNGTTALHAWGLDRGANILRVHDVAPAVECIAWYEYLRKAHSASGHD